jgi:hypothetical protein
MNKFNATPRLLTRLMQMTLYSTLCLGAGCSDVGGQADPKPSAVASILGASSATTDVSVRSGADVVVSGKDSDGIDDPILDFDIQAISVSGDSEITVEMINALLIERNLNTKVFSAPSVTVETVVQFEVVVTDADGVSASDTTSVTILAVGDSDTFLTQAAVSNSDIGRYELVVALDLDPDEVTASSFGVLIETVVQWKPRVAHTDCVLGDSLDRCELVVDTQTITGDWQTGLTASDVAAEDAADAPFNPHFLIDMPAVDADTININYETTDREKRLELENVASANIYHRYSFQAPDNNAKLLVLSRNGTDSGLLVHRYKEALETASSLVDVDTIRSLNLAESVLSAEAYYRILDPLNEADTLNKWLQLRGFVAGVGQEQEFAHALYLNNYDLGFGRNMFMRTDDCGNVYTYVENYPSLELGIKEQNGFATVVMEYSPINPGAAGSCSTDEKIVKFYAFVPDDNSGEQIRMPTMNFDGRGEKSVPGVCTSCHGGGPESMVSYVATHVDTNGADLNTLLTAVDALTSEQKLDLVDLNATFMPFDLDAFLFTQARDSELTDPFYDRLTITDAQIAQFSRENQLAAFRTFNKAALRTYLHKQGGISNVDPEVEAEQKARWDAPIELVNSWYAGLNIASLADIDDIDDKVFDGSGIPDGWLANPDLYHDVYALYCRACHIQMTNTELNFDTLDKFLDTETTNSTRLEDIVFKRGAMPLARLTMDRFWVDFNGGESAASLLQSSISSSSVPGSIEAEFDINNTTPNGVGVQVQLDSLVLGEVDDYQWRFTNDCGSEAFLNNSSSAAANFVTDISPCAYDVTLEVSNDFGSDSISKTIVVDRTPVVTASIAANTADYDPNDGFLVIDIDSLITGDARADSQSEPLDIVINDVDAGVSVNDNTTLDSNGDVVYSFGVFDGVNDTFEYKLRDTNGTISEATGSVSVSIDAISPVLSAPSSLSSTTVGLAWALTDSNLTVDHYVLYRDDTIFDNNVTSTSYNDFTLSEGNTYTYEVVAVLDGVESEKSDPLVVVTAAVPSISSVTPNSASSMQISWSLAGDAPDTFSIYRNGGSTAFKQVAGNVFSTSDTGRDTNSDYSYEVVANFSGSDSDKSGSVSGYTLPAVPASLSVSNITTSALRLSWGTNGNPSGTDYYICDLSSCFASTTNAFVDINVGSSNTAKQYFVYADWAGHVDSSTNKSANTSTLSTSTLVSYTSDIYADMFVNTRDGKAARIPHCTGCHSGTAASYGNFSLNGGSATAVFNELTGVTDGGDSRVNTSSSDYIVGCVNSGCNTMPARSSTYTFSASEIVTLEKWISQGASNN